MQCALLAGYLLLGGFVSAEDWPTYMHDPARSGVSGEVLALPLGELWAYTPPAEPVRAWPNPQAGYNELPKLAFDDATHVAMAGDTVYFGSAADNAVHALDAATGRQRWEFFTEGPVRLAPTVAGGNVYAGSDDGFVYCIDSTDGRQKWSTRASPGATRILGAGRMMSLWPIRTGVVVDGGVAYCGAGIFPARETAVVAFDAATGRQIWRTSAIPKSEAYTSLAPQGYLVASADQIFVPCGRTSPLAYARADGALRGSMVKVYAVVAGKGVVSGDYGVLVDDLYYVGSQNELHAYKPGGTHVATLKGTSRLVATKDRYYRLNGEPPPVYGRNTGGKASAVTAIDRAMADAAPRKGPLPKEAVRWTYSGTKLQTVIVTGAHVIVGGLNEVVALDAATGKVAWKGRVEGVTRGLAVANGRLIASTDKGRIHCFGRGTQAIAARPAPAAIPADAAVAAQADAFLKDSGIGRGYALLVGGDTARLAVELARITKLQIHLAEPDPARAALIRAALSAGGIYGTRVVVDVIPSDPKSGLPYPPYFANLVIADSSAFGKGSVTAREIQRVLKPNGGVLYAGGVAPDAAWKTAGAVSSVRMGGAKEWTKLVRGTLPGARDWTHQYADAGNSASSGDERVRGRPEVLWYGEPGADKMQDRHRGSEAPLSIAGRMFVQGCRQQTNTPILLSFDAYNGLPYWEREFPGAERLDIRSDCGNLACSPRGLFVATEHGCHLLDMETGETRKSYKAPPRADGSPANWMYVAVEGDTLVGSSSAGNQFSNTVFAFDLRTDKLKWRYDSAAIRNSTLAVHGGKVLLVEHRGEAEAPKVLTVAEASKLKAFGKPKAEAPAAPYIRTIVALDLESGRPAWAREHDLTGCGSWTGNLCLAASNDVILLSGVYTAYGRPKGDEDQRRAVAISAKDGALLWNQAIGNRVRALIVGNQVISRPKAVELQSGTPVMRPGAKGSIPWAIAAGGACGQMSASAGMLFYRNGYTVMHDVETGGSVMSFTGMRPGCLINIIPAGGVIVQVEASSGCVCYHAIQSTVVFVPPGAE
jgi:outer membrane protein assembly factor BamB